MNNTNLMTIAEYLKRMCCEVESEYPRWRCFHPLGRDGETKETVDERNLPGDVALR